MKRPVECPACKGKGVVPRPSDELHPLMDAFPLLCDRCSGAGRIEAPPVPSEG